MSQMYKVWLFCSWLSFPWCSSAAAGGPYLGEVEEELEMSSMVLANSKLGFWHWSYWQEVSVTYKPKCSSPFVQFCLGWPLPKKKKKMSTFGRVKGLALSRVGQGGSSTQSGRAMPVLLDSAVVYWTCLTTITASKLQAPSILHIVVHVRINLFQFNKRLSSPCNSGYLSSIKFNIVWESCGYWCAIVSTFKRGQGATV